MFYILHSFQFSSVQSLSRARLFVTPWTAAHQASLSITNSWFYTLQTTVLHSFTHYLKADKR